MVESGSHAELLQLGGKYAELWRRQATVSDVYDATDKGAAETDVKTET